MSVTWTATEATVKGVTVMALTNTDLRRAKLADEAVKKSHGGGLYPVAQPERFEVVALGLPTPGDRQAQHAEPGYLP